MKNYNPTKIKVRFFDEKEFDAYELRDASGKSVEWNSGGYTHPHFDKETAFSVMEYYKDTFTYDKETDTFTEFEDGEIMDSVSENKYGLYELGYDWAWCGQNLGLA